MVQSTELNGGNVVTSLWAQEVYSLDGIGVGEY